MFWGQNSFTSKAGIEIVLDSDKQEQKLKKRNTTLTIDDADATVLPVGQRSAISYMAANTGNDFASNARMINEYRLMALRGLVDSAVDDICNAAIVADSEDDTINLILDDVELSNNIKEKITNEFNQICYLMNINTEAYDIFRNWYVDSKIYAFLVVDDKAKKKGVQKIEFLDPRYVRHIVEVNRDNNGDVDVQEEYFIYNRGAALRESLETNRRSVGIGKVQTSLSNDYVKIPKNAVVQLLSGLVSPSGRQNVGYLEKARKALNNLKALEDAAVIYRITRAPERRVFYIDTGNLPPKSAQEYVNQQIKSYKTEVVYDSENGGIVGNNHQVSMLEDYWLPRREGGRGTEIDTLPAASNLGDIDDILYFRKELMMSLNVPISRLEQDSQINIGAGNLAEVTRDEWKFQKFISRLRAKFSYLPLTILKLQLTLKGILSDKDWDEKVAPFIKLNYAVDDMVKEQQENEILQGRLQALDQVSDYVGKYFSHSNVMRNILKMTDEDIERTRAEILEEQNDEIFNPQTDEEDFI